jgi:hypothetical protein
MTTVSATGFAASAAICVVDPDVPPSVRVPGATVTA